MTDETLKTMCPECRTVRWHDGDAEDRTATCRGCGYESSREERQEARTEERLDDLKPDLKDSVGSEGPSADLSRWSM